MSNQSDSLGRPDGSDSHDDLKQDTELQVERSPKEAPKYSRIGSFFHGKLPKLGRTMTKYPTVVGAQIRASVGYRIRQILYKVDEAVMPWVKRLVPNFIVAHYIYTTFLTILASILIYPQHNIRYIDALFLGAGAATQAGLNTENLNNLTLFQQLSIYLICMLSTPIFIHTLVVFARLYWFEKSLDNIKDKSAKDFRMRRTATIAAIRTQTMDYARTNSMFDQNRSAYNTHNAQEELDARLPDANEDGWSSKHGSEVEAEAAGTGDEDANRAAVLDSNVYNAVEHHSEPSDSDSGREEEQLTQQLSSVPEAKPKNETAKDIQFGELPRPEKRRSRDVDPRDLYMSISMMQHRGHQNNSDVETGPALHINGPAERESRRLPGHHHMHRKFRRQRRNLRLRLLKQQEQRDYMARDELDEMEKEAGRTQDVPAASGANKNASIQFEEPHRKPGDADGPKTPSKTAPPSPNKRFTMSPTMEKWLSHKGNLLPKIGNRINKTFTDRSRRAATVSNPADLTDHELISMYSRAGGTLDKTNYLSWNPTVGRNSTFVALTDDQREELGGVEYRSLKLLSVLLVVYYVGFHLMALFFFLGYIFTQRVPREQTIGDGVSPTWWAFFTSATCFNDLGYTLNPDSMMKFSQSPYIMILASFFIVIGNTGFPIFLRFIIWILAKCSRPLTMYNESLTFLLQHPRRCFTLLFPSGPTWWLFLVLVVLNGIDWVLFIILDFDSAQLRDTPKGDRALNGLFQAFSTRTAGLSVVNVGALNPAIQVSYMIMMYISVMPIAMSIRRTNVYEEQSLGVYLDDDEQDDSSNNNTTKKKKNGMGSFVSTHLRKQLSFDLWFIFLGLFIICLCENKRLHNGDINFQIFQVLFEVVSAYGTVGLSLGYPNYDPSFSGQFTILSKLVIIVMMIRGKQRGLPYSIDRAVVLNTAKLQRRDELQAYHTLKRARTTERTGTLSAVPSESSEEAASTGAAPHSDFKTRLRNVVRKSARTATQVLRTTMMGPGAAIPPSQTLHTSTIPNAAYLGEAGPSRSVTSSRRSGRTSTSSRSRRSRRSHRSHRSGDSSDSSDSSESSSESSSGDPSDESSDSGSETDDSDNEPVSYSSENAAPNIPLPSAASEYSRGA